MINATNKIIFNHSGVELDKNIRSALSFTVEAILTAHDKRDIDLERVSTRTHLELTFPKFVLLGTLKSNASFDEQYVFNALEAYEAGSQRMTQPQFEMFCRSGNLAGLHFKRTYAIGLKTGIGLFLVALHSQRSITLPGTFAWPTNNSKDREGRKENTATEFMQRRAYIASKMACEKSELLSFVRSINTQNHAVQKDDAFAAVGTTQSRVAWYSTYATKLILATGWHVPEDINIPDLLTLRQAKNNAMPDYVTVCKTLLDTLKRKFGQRSNVEVYEWTEALRSAFVTKNLRKVTSNEKFGFSKLSREVLDAVASMNATIATPKNLRKLDAQPGLDFDIQKYASRWLSLQELYLSTEQKESYKQSIQAIGFLNLYLFFYLPYWYQEFPNFKIPFPTSPNLLIKHVFISRIQKIDDMPETFVSFMNARQKAGSITNTTAYVYLKQVEIFFNFIVQHADELPDCEKFKNLPFSQRDYPLTARSIGTPKPRFPSRLFIPFVNYILEVRDYFNCINQKILSGDLEDADKQYQIVKFSGFIDTERVMALYGIPVPKFIAGNEVGGKEIYIKYMPKLSTLAWYKLKDGRVIRLFRPHALNQILAAIYTGLRHNHIQWLDASKFDQFASNEDVDFSKLFVNTDKATKRPWVVDVNIEVIKILRSQHEWRELIAEVGFEEKHFYNNNENTSYPKFKPLFSYSTDGLPHSDTAYASAWSDLISTFETYISQIVGHDNHRYLLSKLRPPGVDFNDLQEQEKLSAYVPSGDRKNVCVLNVKTNYTPHITRVSVVSEYIKYLPATLIGKYITGQKSATVMHYVKTDPEELERLQVIQAREISRLANQQQLNDFVSNEHQADKRYIKADQINSNFAKSVRRNLPEALARYGCFSISFFDADKKDGIDILKEKGSNQAALNKTEICPYGNECPQDVVIMLKGLRRCSLCPYAVRSIDHLPALGAKERQVADSLADLYERIVQVGNKYTEEELDQLETERQRLGEEYAGWKLCIEILVIQHQRVLSGEDKRKWVVERPEIIDQDLRRIPFPSSETQYLLTRLQECVAYPGFQSPRMNSIYEILRLRLLALDPLRKHEALLFRTSVDPASECAGLIRSIAAAHKLGINDIEKIMSKEIPVGALADRLSVFANDLRLPDLIEHKSLKDADE